MDDINLTPAVKAVLDALTELGEGNVHEIAERSGKARSTVDKALRQLADAGLIVEVDRGDDAAEGTPTRWQPTPDAEDGDGTDDGQDDDGNEAADAPARPRPADRKVLIVAGVLGDYPDGATVEAIADASGLGAATVARLLTAMAQADAARRVPADPEAGTPELWQPGEGKASAVDPNPAPERCPTCGQVIRASRTSTAGSANGSGAVNNDGSQPLARGVLRGWVLEFINAHPGHEFTPQDIATELSAQHNREISSGAVRNNCTKAAAAGRIVLVSDTPLTFAHPAQDDNRDTTEAATGNATRP